MLRKLIIFTLSLAVFSCVKDENTQDKNNSNTLAIIVDGSFDDKGFNANASKGVQRLKKELNTTLIEKESSVNSYLADIEGLEDSKLSVLWGIGFKFTDVFLNKANENPEIKYGIIEGMYDSNVKLPSNLVNVQFKSEEGAFLAGVIAAKVSNTGKIGFIGGMQGKIIDSFRYGYEAGAKYINKDTQINSQYVGSFADLALGRSMAKKMYQDGVDVLFPAAGLSGIGAIEAAKEIGPDALIIGADQDQSYLAPENVVISIIKRVDYVVYLLSKGYFENNKWEGGSELMFGLKEDGLGMSLNKTKLNLEIYNEVTKIKEKIINNEIKVPFSKESYEEFVKVN